MSNKASSIIGPDLTILGTVISKGELQIEGEIQGDVKCVSLLLDENAQITGDVVAEDVVVKGRIDGSIRGQTIKLQAGSHVEGDVHHKALVIEHGAYFEGMSRRIDDPTSIETKSRIQKKNKTMDKYIADVKKYEEHSAYPTSKRS